MRTKRPDKNKAPLILDGHKLFWHTDRIRAWLNGERIAPITIDCALTRRCSYRCVYCYGKFQANDEKKMSRGVIFRFLDDAASIGVKAVSFVGDGESTCSPHLYDAIKRAYANGLDVALGTNGYFLGEEKLNEALGRLAYLRFNISAADAHNYAAIMGCRQDCFDKVCAVIKKAVSIKKEKRLKVTIGMQMVLLPEFSGQVVPFAKLGKRLGVDYAVIKHCSDSQERGLAVDYARYHQLEGVLKEAEGYSDGDYLVKAKWSKLLSHGKRGYGCCFGAPFMLQVSGSGLVAPCGMLFNKRYKRYHIGNVADTPFRQIWESRRYWEVMRLLSSSRFNINKTCGTLCLQDKINEFLWDLKNGRARLNTPIGETPVHVNFI